MTQVSQSQDCRYKMWLSLVIADTPTISVNKPQDNSHAPD